MVFPNICNNCWSKYNYWVHRSTSCMTLKCIVEITNHSSYIQGYRYTFTFNICIYAYIYAHIYLINFSGKGIRHEFVIEDYFMILNYSSSVEKNRHNYYY